MFGNLKRNIYRDLQYVILYIYHTQRLHIRNHKLLASEALSQEISIDEDKVSTLLRSWIQRNLMYRSLRISTLYSAIQTEEYNSVYANNENPTSRITFSNSLTFRLRLIDLRKLLGSSIQRNLLTSFEFRGSTLSIHRDDLLCAKNLRDKFSHNFRTTLWSSNSRGLIHNWSMHKHTCWIIDSKWISRPSSDGECEDERIAKRSTHNWQQRSVHFILAQHVLIVNSHLRQRASRGNSFCQWSDETRENWRR